VPGWSSNSLGGSSSNMGGPASVLEPFHFDRMAQSIDAVVSEFERMGSIKKLDHRLGYPTHDEFRTEDRYINNRRTIIRELTYLQDSRGLTQEEAVMALQEELDESGMKIAGFQKELRKRQSKRDIKGKSRKTFE
jgi:hypothetical protein